MLEIIQREKGKATDKRRVHKRGKARDNTEGGFKGVGEERRGEERRGEEREQTEKIREPPTVVRIINMIFGISTFKEYVIFPCLKMSSAQFSNL